MNKSPIISVVIPVYNGEKTIAETITSVLNQTFSDFELLVINDGSTDGTTFVVNSFDDQRIRLINMGNSGPSAARNKGIELSKGDYLSFIDADDLWTPNKIERQFEVLNENPDYDVAYSWTMYIDFEGKILHSMQPVDYEGNVYEKMLVSNFIGSGSNILVTKKALESTGYFNTDLMYGEDWEFFIKLSRNYKFGLAKKFDVQYRQNINSLSSDIEALERDTLAVIENAYNAAPQNLQYLKTKSLSALSLYICYLHMTRQSDKDWSKKVIAKCYEAIKSNPCIIVNHIFIMTFSLWGLTIFIPSNYSRSFVKIILSFYGKSLDVLRRYKVNT